MQAMLASSGSGQYAWMRNKATALTLRPESSNRTYSQAWPGSLGTHSGLASKKSWSGTSGFWILSKCLEHINLWAETGLPASSLHPFGTQKFLSTLRKPSFLEVLLLLIIVIPRIKGWKCQVWLQTLFRVPTLHPHITLHTLIQKHQWNSYLWKKMLWIIFYWCPLRPHLGVIKPTGTFTLWEQPRVSLTTTFYCQQHPSPHYHFTLLRWHVNN